MNIQTSNIVHGFTLGLENDKFIANYTEHNNRATHMECIQHRIDGLRSPDVVDCRQNIYEYHCILKKNLYLCSTTLVRARAKRAPLIVRS